MSTGSTDREPKRSRIMRILDRKKNTSWRCWPGAVKAYMRADERQTVRRLFREYGIKYTKDKRRLRVFYKIPWGVEFDVRNPSACPKAGTWNGPLECFVQVWKDSTPAEREDFLFSNSPRRN